MGLSFQRTRTWKSLLQAVGNDRDIAAKPTTVGEAAAHVQAAAYGWELKADAGVLWHLSNSPATWKDSPFSWPSRNRLDLTLLPSKMLKSFLNLFSRRSYDWMPGYEQYRANLYARASLVELKRGVSLRLLTATAHSTFSLMTGYNAPARMKEFRIYHGNIADLSVDQIISLHHLNMWTMIAMFSGIHTDRSFQDELLAGSHKLIDILPHEIQLVEIIRNLQDRSPFIIADYVGPEVARILYPTGIPGITIDRMALATILTFAYSSCFEQVKRGLQ